MINNDLDPHTAPCTKKRNITRMGDYHQSANKLGHDLI